MVGASKSGEALTNGSRRTRRFLDHGRSRNLPRRRRRRRRRRCPPDGGVLAANPTASPLTLRRRPRAAAAGPVRLAAARAGAAPPSAAARPLVIVATASTVNTRICVLGIGSLEKKNYPMEGTRVIAILFFSIFYCWSTPTVRYEWNAVAAGLFLFSFCSPYTSVVALT